ncbi:hypothetical protein [Oricola thermophila]|uniref:Uncharacterized protein n=1 Tax=Oricola thermophila TaxID=2742145 RepID=A0A6N1VA18_9HYPH|nr:hypothetical protein [Oricola thermophila]QKV17841.1 hypothetical protein HTY61_04895 [Oricola thermophila]
MAKRRRQRRTEKSTATHLMPAIQVNSKAQVLYVEVDNPRYERAHDGRKDNPRKTGAFLNIRESPIVWYRARRQVDDAQALAGDAFRRYYEMAGGAGVQAMDYTKEPVDGGFISDGLTDAKARAAMKLSEAHDILGVQGYRLVESVCAHGMYVKDMTRNHREASIMLNNLRMCLDALAESWGMQTRNRIRHSREA